MKDREAEIRKLNQELEMRRGLQNLKQQISCFEYILIYLFLRLLLQEVNVILQDEIKQRVKQNNFVDFIMRNCSDGIIAFSILL